MKRTTDEIDGFIAKLSDAMECLKQARRVSKKVYASDSEVAANLKYGYRYLNEVIKAMESE